jgi:hypothetical protein
MAGATNAAAYDPRLVTVLAGDNPITAVDEGEFISVDRATPESIKYKEGAYGDVLVSISSSRLYIVTLKLQASSRSNRLLQTYHDQFVATGRGWFPLVVNDINDDTKTKFSSPQACVMAAPPLKGAAEAGSKEWKILCSNGKLVHEGMPELA